MKLDLNIKAGIKWAAMACLVLVEIQALSQCPTPEVFGKVATAAGGKKGYVSFTSSTNYYLRVDLTGVDNGPICPGGCCYCSAANAASWWQYNPDTDTETSFAFQDRPHDAVTWHKSLQALDLFSWTTVVQTYRSGATGHICNDGCSPGTSATDTYMQSLSQEYTDGHLFSDVKGKLDAVAFPSSYAPTPDGNYYTGAQVKSEYLWTTQNKSLQLKKAKYHIELSSTEKDATYTVEYQIRFDPEGGGEPSYEVITVDILGTGGLARYPESGELDLEPPQSPGRKFISSICLKKSTCGCGDGDDGDPGTSDPDTGSMKLRIFLGKGTFGRSAGTLNLYSQVPTPSLTSPNTLAASLTDAMVEKVMLSGVLRQVRTPQVLVDVIMINGYKYDLRFYHVSQYGSTKVSGVYPPVGSPTPFVTHTIENPNGAGGVNTLKITETRGASSWVNQYDYDGGNKRWDLTSGGGLRKKRASIAYISGNTVRQETREILNAAAQAVSKVRNDYAIQPFGDALTTSVVDPGGAALTTSYTYWTGISDNGYGKVKQITYPDGNWEYFTYTADGNVHKHLSAHKNQVFTTDENLARVTEYSYASVDMDDTLSLDPDSPRTTIHYVPDDTNTKREVSRSYLIRRPNVRIHVQCVSPNAAAGDSSNLRSTNTYVASGTFAGYLESKGRPDGTMDIYTYSDNGGGTERTITVYSGEPNGAGTAIVNGTKTVTVYGSVGEILSERVYDKAGATETLVGERGYSYSDLLKKSYTVTHLDGRTESASYDCCGMTSSTDKDGKMTDYLYDPLKRRVGTLDLSIQNTNLLDAAGRVLVSHRVGTDNSTITTFQAAYDVAGRMTSSTNALNGKTTYSESYATGVRIVTTTHSDGGTRIDEYFKDGRLNKVTGTAVQPVRYVYGAKSDGGSYREYTREIKLGASPTYSDTSEWIETYTDGAGRSYKTVFSAASGPYPSQSTTYVTGKGQLKLHTDPDGVITRYAYNPEGEVERSAIDLDPNDGDAINNSVDEIQASTNIVGTFHSTTVFRTSNFVYSGSSPLLVGLSERSVDGLKSWETRYRDGSTPVESSSITSYGSGGSRTVTTTNPDGSYAISAYSYGRLQSLTRFAFGGSQIGQTSYGYDPHGRVSTTTDARNGTTTYAYNAADQVLTVTSPPPGTGQAAQVTQTAYDNMGRLTDTTQPDGAVTSNEYHVTGQLKKTYGGRVYPVEYTYDSQGRMKTMTTWQDYSNPGTTAATTSWNYDAHRGWLSSKDYPNSSTGAAGTTGPDYTYHDSGRLKTRTWARGVLTTYKYGFNDAVAGNQHGQLTVIDYGDTTPDVTYTYDRRGRRATALANSITTTFSYNEADQLTGESWSGGTLNTWNVNPVYDTKLRRNQLRVNKNAVLQIQHDYVYDNASRLQQVYQGSYTANYAYEANSPLIDSVTHKYSSTTRLTADRTHDKLNRLTVMANTPQSGLPVSFAYQYNDANQRIRTVLADGSYWVYEYDEQGQVIRGRRFWADHTPVAGQQFDYAFDDIGNRQTTLAGGDQTGGNQRNASYTADRLNRYSSRTVPASFDVLGLATATSAVTVNSQTAYRKGEYFRREVTASNSSAPDWEGVTVSVSGLSSVTGNVWVPQTPEAYTYDDDGNTLTDGRWTYTWDAESRLVRLVARTAVGPQQRIDFEYDHQGRRIRKTVYNNTAGTPPAATDLKFIYDEWNLIAEVSSADALVRQYMWGLDLAGSLQDAGGVGGLVKIYDHASSKTYFPGYDGNGNVALLVDGGTGAAGAVYEYGPFGELIRSSGMYALTNPFRFSTKYQDKETDLLYYGYRYYDPSTGRWINRDPIEERGGINLFAAFHNSPVNSYDALGRETTDLNPLPGDRTPPDVKPCRFLGWTYDDLGASIGRMVADPDPIYESAFRGSRQSCPSKKAGCVNDDGVKYEAITPDCTIKIIIRHGVDPLGKTRRGVIPIDHELAHVRHYISSFRKKQSFVNRFLKCVPSDCDDERLSYVRDVVKAYRTERDYYSAVLHIQEYPISEVPFWRRYAERTKSQYNEARSKASQSFVALNACLEANCVLKMRGAALPDLK